MHLLFGFGASFEWKLGLRTSFGQEISFDASLIHKLRLGMWFLQYKVLVTPFIWACWFPSYKFRLNIDLLHVGMKSQGKKPHVASFDSKAKGLMLASFDCTFKLHLSFGFVASFEWKLGLHTSFGQEISFDASLIHKLRLGIFLPSKQSSLVHF